MNPVQVHMLLNHFPILGLLFGASLLLYGVVRKEGKIIQAGLVTLVIIGILTIPAYFSGEEAEHLMEDLPGIDKVALEEHEEGSGTGMALNLVTAVLALITALSNRFRPTLHRPLSFITLLAAIGAFVYMVNLGHQGGLIRHPELEGVAQPVGPEQGEEQEKEYE